MRHGYGDTNGHAARGGYLEDRGFSIQPHKYDKYALHETAETEIADDEQVSTSQLIHKPAAKTADAA